MKKIIAVSLSAMLAVSLFAFTACNGKDELGVVEGNYKEATAEEIKSALEGVDADKLFGDTSADDYNFGIQLTAQTNAEISIGDSYSVKENASANAQLALSLSEDNICLLGSGSASLQSEMKSTGMTVSMNYNADAYVDNDYVYVSATVQQTTQKIKINIEELINYVLDGGDSFLPDEGGAEDGSGEYPDVDFGNMSFDEYLETLEQLHVKTYLDTSKGLKVKISFTEESVTALIDLILAEITAEEGENSEYAETVTAVFETLEFSEMQLDYYLALDEDGTFSEYAIDMNIAFTLDAPAFGATAGMPTGTISANLNCAASLKAYNGTITLPEGLAEDDSYYLYSFKDNDFGSNVFGNLIF